MSKHNIKKFFRKYKCSSIVFLDDKFEYIQFKTNLDYYNLKYELRTELQCVNIFRDVVQIIDKNGHRIVRPLPDNDEFILWENEINSFKKLKDLTTNRQYRYLSKHIVSYREYNQMKFFVVENAYQFF